MLHSTFMAEQNRAPMGQKQAMKTDQARMETNSIRVNEI